MTDGAPTGGSGPRIAGLFHRMLAVIYLIAWVSLGSQVRLLVGKRGLLPLVDFVEAARGEGSLSVLTFPSLLALAPGDGPLLAGTVAGAVVAVAGLMGIRPRLCAALSTGLYLGYVTACRSFLGFQWDNLLLECGLLATFLPTDRPAPIAHLVLRALVFKLYFESGIAKWLSPAHDWRDGTAMTFYYETAPLPTTLAWYAHHLPRWWHLFESRATLVIELVVPFGVFGGRRIRLVTAALFTLFQIINAATANYGFFCYLTLALHLFLLDEADLERLRDRIGRTLGVRQRAIRDHLPIPGVSWAMPRFLRRRPDVSTPVPLPARGRLRRATAVVGVMVWCLVSLTEALFHFGDPGPSAALLVPVLELSQTFRVVNTFHLFAAVTRERIEPEIQTRVNDTWTPLAFHYKPGDPKRPPPFVAPHQPRVDFLLWFYGLGYQRRQPIYVTDLLARLCEDPAAVAPLFESPLPDAPQAVRIVFWDTRFTSAAQKRATGAWWSRREIASTPPFPCSR
jgi:lipase maturation factor 1